MYNFVEGSHSIKKNCSIDKCNEVEISDFRAV